MLLASVMVKQYYLVMITDVVGESYEAELESFEEDFKKMLEVRIGHEFHMSTSG